jgi:hypothetical protein
MALFTALRLPQVFRKVISQSGAFNLPDRSSIIRELLQLMPPPDIDIWMDAGRLEYLLDANRKMYSFLREKKYSGGKVFEGFNWLPCEHTCYNPTIQSCCGGGVHEGLNWGDCNGNCYDLDKMDDVQDKKIGRFSNKPLLVNILILPAFILAGFLIYFPSLKAELVYDDLHTILQNPFIKVLEPRRFFSDSDTFSAKIGNNPYRPVVVLSGLGSSRTPNMWSPVVTGGGQSDPDPLNGRTLRSWLWPFGMTEGEFPKLRAGSGLEDRATMSEEGVERTVRDLEENLRLLYVGCTRAKTKLV